MPPWASPTASLSADEAGLRVAGAGFHGEMDYMAAPRQQAQPAGRTSAGNSQYHQRALDYWPAAADPQAMLADGEPPMSPATRWDAITTR